MVAFCTEDLFFFEIAPSVKPMSPKIFACPPQNSVLATCQKVMAIFFKNDVIFAMKSQRVQILYITLLFETESQNAYVKLVMSQKRLLKKFSLK